MSSVSDDLAAGMEVEMGVQAAATGPLLRVVVILQRELWATMMRLLGLIA